MNTSKVKSFDISEHLESQEDIAEYLTACAEQGEQYLFAALGEVAKSIGMTKIAKNSGLERNGLYRAFKQDASSTQYKTVSKALGAMGLHIEIKPNSEAAAL